MSIITLGVGGVSNLDSFITTGLEVDEITPFVAYIPYIGVSLPPQVEIVLLPVFQPTDITTVVTGSTRITEQSNTRTTRAGNTRVTRDYTTASRPERVAVKLPGQVINISVSPRTQ